MPCVDYSVAVALKPRPEVARLAAPSPPEQPAPGQRLVKLNTAEAPFPPSPKVMAAIRDLEPEPLRAYPSPTADRFREAAARLHGVAPENVIAGNGSDELLAIAMRAFVPAGGRIATPWPAYPQYGVLAALRGAEHVRCEWTANWTFPAQGLLASKAEAIIVPNPSDISGTLVSFEELAQLAEKFRGLLVIDEAYADFADGNCLQLIRERENVLVTRSLSKGYALAGLRFGYALAGQSVIAAMIKAKDPHNTSAISQTAAIAAIEDQEYAAQMWKHVREERARLTLELQLFGFEVPASQANFVLVRHPELPSTSELYEGLRKQGVLVHHSNEKGFADALRITVGTSQENNALLGALEQLLGERRAPGDAPSASD